VNVVTLIGNLASDVELRKIDDERQVASFLLAVDRPSQDGGADFIRIAAWNRQAETCAEYLAKGAKVGVDGRLRSRSWEEDGKRRRVVEVVGTRVDFLGGPRREEEGEGEGAEVIPFEAATA